ncbi:S-norcoclaurine synthase 1-like [Canna indica]|uniref:S-norcoclaurine synthase 1-like n=1 Tax=Canna indica TaxID=4628 RepID=A0AAQ3KWG4_9LILI|nr:S-norcoclaurine synthase 1-like [Canna indica]
MEKVKSVIVEFFELPVEEKKGFAQVGNSLQGYGQSFVVSEDQKLDWGDMFYLVARPLCPRDLSFWPTHPSSFRETLSAYSSEVRRIASTLLQLMAKNLEIAPNDFSDIFQDQPQGRRMNYYPPYVSKSRPSPRPFPAHRRHRLNASLQVSQVQGLQIKKDGKWFPVQPLPHAFTVNIGDIYCRDSEQRIIQKRRASSDRRRREGAHLRCGV